MTGAKVRACLRDGAFLQKEVVLSQSPTLDPEAFIRKALTLLASERYLEKGMGLIALTGRRPPKSIFCTGNQFLPLCGGGNSLIP